MDTHRITKNLSGKPRGTRSLSKCRRSVSPAQMESFLATEGPETQIISGCDSQPDISIGPIITPFDLIMMNVLDRDHSTDSYPTNTAFILARAGYDSNGTPLQESVRLPNSLAAFTSGHTGVPPTGSGHTPFSAAGSDGRAFLFDRGPHGQKPHPFDGYVRRSAEQPAYSTTLGVVPAIAIDPPQRYMESETSQISSVGHHSVSHTLGSSLSVPNVSPSPDNRSGTASPASSASTPGSFGITSAPQSPLPLSADLDEFLQGFLKDDEDPSGDYAGDSANGPSLNIE